MLSGAKQVVFARNYDRKPRNHDQKQKTPDQFEEIVLASEDQDDSNT